MDKKKLLIFHPTIAPYRIDLFNSLYEGFDTQVCLFYRNLKSQQFDYSKIEAQFCFTPVYLKTRIKLLGRIVYGGIWKHLRNFKPNIVIVNEFSLCSIWVLFFKWLFRRKFRVISICDDSYNIVAEHNEFSIMHRLSRKLVTPFLDELILVEPRVAKWYHEHYHKGFYFPIIRDDEKARAIYNRLLSRSVLTANYYRLSDKFVFLFYYHNMYD